MKKLYAVIIILTCLSNIGVINNEEEKHLSASTKGRERIKKKEKIHRTTLK